MKFQRVLISLVFWLSFGQIAEAQDVSYKNRSYENALLIAKYVSAGNRIPVLNDSMLSMDGKPIQAKVDPVQLNVFIDKPFSVDIDTVALQKEISELRKYDAMQIAKSKGEATLAFGAASDAVKGLAPSTAYQSMVIDAVAKLVAEQFQESVSTVYLNRLRERIQQVQGLPELLPKTYDLLQRGNFFRFNAIGQEFKTVFEDDLQELPANLNAYLESAPSDSLPKPFSNLKAATFYPAFHFSSDAADKLIHGYTPAQLLDYLAAKYQDESRYLAYYQAIEMINILQKNLQDESKLADAMVWNPTIQKRQFQNIWLDFDQFQKIQNPKNMGFFLGLIFQDNRSFFGKLLGGNGMNSTLQDKLKAQLIPALTVLTKLNALLEKEQISADDYNLLMQHCMTLIELANKIPENPPLTGNELTIFHKVIDIHKSIIRKDYALIVPNLIYLFDQLPVETDKHPTTEWVCLRNILTKYGPFISGVAAAQNSDELKDVLKKAVLPNGSYAAKRLSLSSLTLAAHPGIVGGAERLYKSQEGLSPQGDFQASLGFTVPIGFEFTWGIRQRKEPSVVADRWEKHRFINRLGHSRQLSGGYVGVMLQIADIGAVVNYRLNDPDKELPAQITFKQVFSPGVSLHYGFPGTPITVGAGVQYTPALRQLDDTNGAKIDLNAFRLQARLTWDLPLVNFYMKTEKKPKN